MLLLRTFLESDKTENVRLSLSYAEHKNDGFWLTTPVIITVTLKMNWNLFTINHDN